MLLYQCFTSKIISSYFWRIHRKVLIFGSSEMLNNHNYPWERLFRTKTILRIIFRRYGMHSLNLRFLVFHVFNSIATKNRGVVTEFKFDRCFSYQSRPPCWRCPTGTNNCILHRECSLRFSHAAEKLSKYLDSSVTMCVYQRGKSHGKRDRSKIVMSYWP